MSILRKSLASNIYNISNTGETTENDSGPQQDNVTKYYSDLNDPSFMQNQPSRDHSQQYQNPYIDD